MKHILITGTESYIGTHLHEWLNRDPEHFTTTEVDVRGEFAPDLMDGMDAVVHVAGIAHRKEQPGDETLYQSVNCDLAVRVAKMAREHGVRQFIYLSSMSVYGKWMGEITGADQPAPNTMYGRSKWNAEQQLSLLQTDDFHVAVLRPPMVYGKGCKGNYPRLASLAVKLPCFPKISNQRSMVYIDILCACIEKLLRSGDSGLYFPQNREYVCTSAMVRCISQAHGHRLCMMGGLNSLLKPFIRRITLLQKLLGSLTYSQEMSQYFSDIPQPSFEETIRQTEAPV